MTIDPNDRDAWVRLLREDTARFGEIREAVGDDVPIDLSGADLSNLDLSRTWLGRANLEGARLTGAQFNVMSLMKCRLKDVVGLDSAVLLFGSENSQRDVRMLALLWRDIPAFNRERKPTDVITDCDLSGADLGGADFSNLALANSRLDGAILSKVKIWSTNLDQTSLVGARFDGGVIEACSLHNANMSHATFVGATILRAHWIDAVLDHARFDGAHIQSSAIIRGSARSAGFRGATLDGCSIGGAKFNDGDFVDTVWRDCRVHHSDFTGCRFDSARNERSSFGDNVGLPASL